MTIKAPRQPRPPQIALVIDASEDPAIRIPARHLLGSTGASLLVHLAVILVLSMFLIAQSSPSIQLVSELRLAEDEGHPDEAEWVNMDVLDLSKTESPRLEVAAMTSLISETPSMATDMRVNLNAFSDQQSTDGQQGLPAAIAAIAGGIQGRVSKAGGRTGEVQFSLAWHSLNDVDLHVIAPSGEHISYGHRTSQCNGELDVDMNAGTQSGENDKSFSEEPVENIRWLPRKAPSGRFTVLIHQFRWRNGQDTDKFQLLVNLGETTQLIEGVVTARQPISIHRFQYARTSLSKGRQKQLVDQMIQLQKREETEASKLLEDALPMPVSSKREQTIRSIIASFPHTDASIRAMQELEGSDKF